MPISQALSPSIASGESASPAEPSSSKARPKHNRSRGGCTRCRQRRQKCDELRPSCTRCRAHGVGQCAYTVSLSWGGRDFKSYKANSDIRKHETEPGTFVYVASSRQKTLSREENRRLSRSLSPFSSSNPAEQLLLYHFATSASRITSCHSTIQSSFCQLLIPMATSYPPLHSALLALSAIHLNTLYPTPSFPGQGNEIISLKASSIAQLRADILHQPMQSMRDVVLATALMLCMCEIHSGADQPRSWRLHLEGAKAILSSATSFATDPTSQAGLLQRWYTSIEALAAISSKGLQAGDLPPFNPSGLERSIAEVESEKEVFLDDYFGFSTDLVGVFKEIGALAWERRSLSLTLMHDGLEHVPLSPDDLTAEALILESRIKSMIDRDRNDPLRFYPGIGKKLSNDVVKEFHLCNEAYQHAALLHIYRRVVGIKREDERVQGAVKRILECVEGITPREGLSPYIVLTMPLFTAGVEALRDEREVVRGRMRELGEVLKLRNVWRSLEILEEGWILGNEGFDEENYDFIPY